MTPEEYELLMGQDYSSKPYGSVEGPPPTWDEYWKDQTDRHLSAIDPSSDMGDLDRVSTLWGNFAPGTILPRRLKADDYLMLLSSGRKKEGLTAAIKDPVHGKIYTGMYHPAILDDLQVAADMGNLDKSWVKQLQDHYMHGRAGYGKSEMDKLFGFVNDAGEFFTRHEAAAAFGADEAAALYRRIRQEAPWGFGERPIDNPVNPNPVKAKPKKAKGLIPLAAGPGLLEGYEPDYSLLVEGAYDEPVQGKYLLDSLKKAAEKFLPSGPQFPTPSDNLGIRGQVQGISPTPPEPGRNRLAEIPQAISELPGQYREGLSRHMAAIDPSSNMTDPDRWATLWGSFAPGSVRIPSSGAKAASMAETMVREGWRGKPIEPSFLGIESNTPQMVSDAVRAAHAGEEFLQEGKSPLSARSRVGFAADITKATDPDSASYLAWINKNRNQIAIHPNMKTGLSMDFTTSCCARAGNKGACAYCYVEQPRTGFNELGLKKYIVQNKRLVETPYRGELKTMPQGLVYELNKDGGLRGQSFSDYIPEKHEALWQAALDDAAGLATPMNPQGLMLKIITKKLDMVERFASHPNARFNISIDYLPKGMSNAPAIEEAVAMKARFPKNVRVRSVALNEQQALQQLADPRIDVITLYHGPVGEELFNIVKAQNPQLIAHFGEDAIRAELATWQNMGPKSKIHKVIEAKSREMYGISKTCCEGGKCASDPTKCGFGTSALGALIMGVEIPDKEEL